MKVLLDTHAMLWWLVDDPRLSDKARETIAEGRNQLFWSIASAFELAVKVGVGKLELGRSLRSLFAEIVSEQGAELLPMTHEHCVRLGNLELHHRDPFDRMLVAQALEEGIPLLTADPKMELYPIDRLW
jgi:PIN domain nuclease of toxin-antitoxin system